MDQAPIPTHTGHSLTYTASTAQVRSQGEYSKRQVPHSQVQRATHTTLPKLLASGAHPALHGSSDTYRCLTTLLASGARPALSGPKRYLQMPAQLLASGTHPALRVQTDTYRCLAQLLASGTHPARSGPHYKHFAPQALARHALVAQVGSTYSRRASQPVPARSASTLAKRPVLLA